MSLSLEIKDFIQSQGLIKTGDNVILGVSGGPDSVALLHLLYNLRHDFGISLSIAHYNHNLRPSAKLDQQFVKKLAEKLKLSYYTDTWKNPPRKDSKGSLEELAREQRLKFFDRLVKKNPNAKIALAHTQDDLAETVLMRILRGTGLQGLRSILPQTKINDLVLIRPLLEVSKKELLSYLQKNHLSYRRDPMNKDLDFFRNKIRLELLPLLQKEYNPNIQELLTHLSQTVAIDYAYLRQEAQKKFSALISQFPPRGANSKRAVRIRFNLNQLQKIPQALQRMILRLAIEHLRGDTHRLTLKHIEQLESLLSDPAIKKAAVHLPKDVRCQKTTKELIFYLK